MTTVIFHSQLRSIRSEQASVVTESFSTRQHRVHRACFPPPSVRRRDSGYARVTPDSGLRSSGSDDVWLGENTLNPAQPRLDFFDARKAFLPRYRDFAPGAMGVITTYPVGSSRV